MKNADSNLTTMNSKKTQILLMIMTVKARVEAEVIVRKEALVFLLRLF
jgi:hypothetical protein